MAQLAIITDNKTQHSRVYRWGRVPGEVLKEAQNNTYRWTIEIIPARLFVGWFMLRNW